MTHRDNRFFSRGRTLIIPALFLMVLPIFGCGYQFRADGKPMGLDMESLAIPMVTSPSSTLGFEADFTRVLREEFISHGRVPIKPKEEARMILNGNIRVIQTEPLSYNIQEFKIEGYVITNEVTRMRGLTIVCDVSLVDTTTGKIIWHEGSLREETNFLVTYDPLVNRYNQRKALEKIARDLSKKIFLKTMERF